MIIIIENKISVITVDLASEHISEMLSYVPDCMAFFQRTG
jgi:hypothetical protein